MPCAKIMNPENEKHFAGFYAEAENENDELRAEVGRLRAGRGHANLRLVAALLYAYLDETREGWEEGPSRSECMERIHDEVYNLDLGGVDTAVQWLKDHDAEIRAAHAVDLSEWYHPTAPGQRDEEREG